MSIEPKAELHVHIEGTVTPSMARQKAKEHGMTLPEEIFVPDGTAYIWNDFIDLVTRVYDAVASVIRTKQDYADITYDYLTRCAAEDCFYVELILSPDHGISVGLSYPEMLEGVAGGIDKARAETGIEARMNAVLVRHMPMEKIEQAAEMIVTHRHPYLTGLDLAGAEQEGDVLQFSHIFKMIHEKTNNELGMRIHAGEAAGPQNVRDALALGCVRIGHGVRVWEDQALVAELVEKGVVLEIAPTSNVLAGIYPFYQDHPLRQLFNAGVRLTLNSDDPGLFGNSIGMEYQIAKDEFGLDKAQRLTITRTAIEAAFVDKKTRQKLLAKL